MLIPLGLNSTNLSSGKLIKNIRLAGDRGNSLVSATVTNNMFRVRSSHKSLTVYLEVPSNWTEKYIIAKAKWKYAARYVTNAGQELTTFSVSRQLASFKKADALSVIDIHEL
jgi:hypothetical protein